MRASYELYLGLQGQDLERAIARDFYENAKLEKLQKTIKENADREIENQERLYALEHPVYAQYSLTMFDEELDIDEELEEVEYDEVGELREQFKRITKQQLELESRIGTSSHISNAILVGFPVLVLALFNNAVGFIPATTGYVATIILTITTYIVSKMRETLAKKKQKALFKQAKALKSKILRLSKKGSK